VSTVYWFSQDLSNNSGTNDWFSEREKAILEKLQFTKRRSDWRLGRFTAKEMIVRFLQKQNEAVQFHEIEILPEADGSPKVFLKNESVSFSISISHSHNRVFCALSPASRPIGCDLEYLEERSENFVKDYFTESEIAFIKNCPAEQKNLASNLIWSAKESTLKALKEGLRLDTHAVNIIIDSLNFEKDWQNFIAQVDKSENYHGFWKQTGDFVITIVCNQLIKNLQEL
jgi:4'-phosphopantetheinyl transferase